MSIQDLKTAINNTEEMLLQTEVIMNSDSRLLNATHTIVDLVRGLVLESKVVESSIDSTPVIETTSNSNTTSAIKYDSNKLRYDLIPVRPLRDTTEILTFGSQKYSDRNWERGFEWSRVYAALQRHLQAWWGGEDKDPESGKSHLAHAACCLLFLQEYEYTHPELDNRVKQ